MTQTYSQCCLSNFYDKYNNNNFNFLCILFLFFPWATVNKIKLRILSLYLNSGLFHRITERLRLEDSAGCHIQPAQHGHQEQAAQAAFKDLRGSQFSWPVLMTDISVP